MRTCARGCNVATGVWPTGGKVGWPLTHTTLGCGIASRCGSHCGARGAHWDTVGAPLGDSAYPTGGRGVPHWGTVRTHCGTVRTPLGDGVGTPLGHGGVPLRRRVRPLF